MEPTNLFLSAINPENFRGNTSLVVERLLIDGPLSITELAQRAGLAKPTISRLVQELLDVSGLRETGIIHMEKGRLGVLLQINPDTGFILAAEIRVDFFRLFNRISTPKFSAGGVAAIQRQVSSLIGKVRRSALSILE